MGNRYSSRVLFTDAGLFGAPWIIFPRLQDGESSSQSPNGPTPLRTYHWESPLQEGLTHLTTISRTSASPHPVSEAKRYLFPLQAPAPCTSEAQTCMLSCSVAQLCSTAYHPMDCSPLSMESSRQEDWNGLPFPSPGDLPDPRSNPPLLYLQADSLPLSHLGSPLPPRGAS